MQNAIVSRDNQHVKYACRIAQSAGFRQSQGVFFAEGQKLCLELLQFLPPVAVFVTQHYLENCGQAQAFFDDAFVVSESVAKKLASAQTPQGLFCLFKKPALPPQNISGQNGVLICENMQDPKNVGAVLRSAAALGFGGVILANACADPFSPKALRASVGAVCRIPICQTEDLQGAVLNLKNAGTTVFAAALQNAVPIGKAQIKPPFALMVGNEGAGLSPLALQMANSCVFVPMQNGVESLNAAAAAAVIMYAMKNNY